MSSCGNRCNQGLEALCTSCANLGNNCGGRNARCGCQGCVTSIAVLKSSVSERACCSSKDAHIFAYNTGTTTIAAGGTFTFDHIGDNASIFGPGQNGNGLDTFTIPFAGSYLIIVMVLGTSQTAGTNSGNSLVVVPTLNGSSIGISSSTSYNLTAAGGINVLGTWSYILSFPSNSTFSLTNGTNAFGDTVVLTSKATAPITGSPQIINASVTINRIC